MWEWLESVLWTNRNEPLAVIFSAFLLIVVLVALVYQTWYRQAPLYCKDMLFPSRATDCPGVTRPIPPTKAPAEPIPPTKAPAEPIPTKAPAEPIPPTKAPAEPIPPTKAPAEAEPIPPTVVPVGTIVPYLGNDDDIPPGWVLCDGRDNPSNSQIRYDADSERGGIQLPDLRSRFIRGSYNPLNLSGIQEGGNDTISLKHAHLWAHFGGKHWHSYNEKNAYHQVDNWDNGMHHKGAGEYPLLIKTGSKKNLYTDQGSIEKVSTLPKYVELRFIIRIF